MSNQLREGLVASGIMLFSAVVLVVIAGVLHRPDQAGAAKPYVISGDQLKLIVGSVVPSDGVLKLEGLQNGMAVISSGPVRFSAHAFPYMTVHQSGFTQSLTVNLFWRQREQENILHTQQLYRYGDGSLTLHLANNPDWNGEIVELGLSVEGVLKQPFVVETLALEHWSIFAWAVSIWDQWWSYGGWKGTSINFISGGSYDKIQDIAPPELPMLPVVASWLGVSLGLYLLIWHLLSLKLSWHLPLVMLLMAWLLLDSRWLHELWRRTQVTQSQYSGKTQQQKWQSEQDGQWYLMAEQIKRHIPEQSARIFQVMKSQQPIDDYYRFRVRYHLLPHNVFPYMHSLPERSDIHSGDYILDLGEQTRLRYDTKINLLADTGSTSSSLQPVILKYQSRLGRLYQYQGQYQGR